MKTAVTLSVGLLALLSAAVGSDFDVSSIGAPPDTVRELTTWTPWVVLHADEGNAGAETVQVQLRIGSSYLEQTSAVLSPGTYHQVSFPTGWVAGPVGTSPARCSLLVQDSIPDNDTLSRNVLVLARLVDFAVSGLTVAPSPVELGEDVMVSVVAYAQAYNPATETVAVRLQIGTSYDDTVRVELDPGEYATFAFPAWQADTLGTIEATCSLVGPDSSALNDTARAWVTVLPPPDIEVVSIQSPPDTVRQLEWWSPTVVLHAAQENAGPEQVSAQMRVGANYFQTVTVTLYPGQYQSVTFAPTWQAESVGSVVARCSLVTQDANPANDTLSEVIAVLARPKDFVASSMTVSPPVVEIGEEATASVTIHALEYNPWPETVAVWLRIGAGYDDTARIWLNPGQYYTLNFPPWQADTVGVMDVSFVLLGQDSVPANDTLRGAVTVIPPPDIEVVSIQSPPDTVRQLDWWMPTVLLHAAAENAGSEAVVVQLRIGPSYQAQASTVLYPGQYQSVTFTPPWQAESVGSVVARCSLVTQDGNPANDTLSKGVAVLARPKDFAAMNMTVAPPMVEIGDEATVTVLIHALEYNPWPETVAVRLRIGTGYEDTVSVWLNPGQYYTSSFPSWQADTVGVLDVSLALLGQDSVPANDTLRGTVTVVPHPDFDVASIFLPPDTVRELMTWMPSAMLHAAPENAWPEMVYARMSIGPNYVGTASAWLSPGQSLAVTFTPAWTADSAGLAVARCSLLTQDANPANDTLSRQVTILAARRDFAVSSLVLPSILRQGDNFVPTATVHADAGNPRPEQVLARLETVPAYDDTVSIWVAPGQYSTVSFDSWPADSLGTFTFGCELLVSDSVPDNDTLSLDVTVLARLEDFSVNGIYTNPPVIHQGETVYPAASVQAQGFNPQPKTISVWLRIGTGYNDTVSVALYPGQSATLSFDSWLADILGNVEAQCALLATDSMPYDDTARTWLTVLPPGSDFSVQSITAPQDTVLLNASVAPVALIHAAEGNQAESTLVRMRIGTTYDDTVTAVIQAGQSQQVTFPVWHAEQTGSFSVRCSLLTPDNDTTNNAGSRWVTVKAPTFDFAVLSITSPPDTVLVDSFFTPAALVRAAVANQSETALVRMTIGTTYADTVVAVIPAGETLEVPFSAWQAHQTGSFTARCSLLTQDTDTSNGAVAKYVRVTEPGGSAPDTWTRLYGAGQSAAARALTRTSDGGYILCGWRNHDGLQIPDMYVVKTDSEGICAWERTVGTGDESQEAYAILQTATGSFVVAGWRANTSIVLGLDSTGNTLWQKDMFAGDTCIDYGYSSDFVPTDDGGFAAVSVISAYYLQGIGSNKEGMVLTKLDSIGNRQWRVLFQGEVSQTSPAGLRQCHDGGYVICCNRDTSGVWLVRTDPSGATAWMHTYPTAHAYTAFAVRQGPDRGFVITGMGANDTSEFGRSNMCLMRTDSLGNLVWRRDYGYAGFDVGYCVEAAEDGGYIVCGYTQSSTTFEEYAYIVKVDVLGVQQWSATYGGPLSNDARAIIPVGNGDWVVCGQGFHSPTTETYAAYLRKLRPSWK